MKITESRAVQLLATVLDGSAMGDGTSVPAMTCGICSNWKVRFTASAGLVARCKVAQDTVTCVNTRCLAALKAKPMLDALKNACAR